MKLFGWLSFISAETNLKQESSSVTCQFPLFRPIFRGLVGEVRGWLGEAHTASLSPIDRPTLTLEHTHTDSHFKLKTKWKLSHTKSLQGSQGPEAIRLETCLHVFDVNISFINASMIMFYTSTLFVHMCSILKIIPLIL